MSFLPFLILWPACSGAGIGRGGNGCERGGQGSFGTVSFTSIWCRLNIKDQWWWMRIHDEKRIGKDDERWYRIRMYDKGQEKMLAYPWSFFFWSFVSLSYPPLSFLILYCPFVSFVILYPPLLSFHTLYHPLLSFIIPAFSLIAFSGSSFSLLSYPLSQHNLPSLFHSPLVPSLFTNTVHIYT